MAKASLGAPIPVGIIDPAEGRIAVDTPSLSELPAAQETSADTSSFPKLWVDTMMAPLVFWTSAMAALLQSVDHFRPHRTGDDHQAFN